MLRKLCALCLFVCCTSPAFATETYPMELMNDSGAAITNVYLTPVDPAPPYGPTGDTQRVTQKIAHRAKGTVDRMEGQELDIRIVTEKDSYLFQGVDFWKQFDTAARLHLLDRGVPELIFYDPEDPKTELQRVQGDNSAWGIKPVMGSIPYGPGVTTLAAAEALGGLAKGKTPGQRTGTVKWQDADWQLTLGFSGEDPKSVLEFVSLVHPFKDGESVNNVPENMMKQRGYVEWLRAMTPEVGNGARVQDCAALTAKNPGIADDALLEKIHGEAVDLFEEYPQSLWMLRQEDFAAQVEAMREGRSPNDLLRNSDTILVANVTDAAEATTSVLICTGKVWAAGKCNGLGGNLPAAKAETPKAAPAAEKDAAKASKPSKVSGSPAAQSPKAETVADPDSVLGRYLPGMSRAAVAKLGKSSNCTATPPKASCRCM